MYQTMPKACFQLGLRHKLARQWVLPLLLLGRAMVKSRWWSCQHRLLHSWCLWYMERRPTSLRVASFQLTRTSCYAWKMQLCQLAGALKLPHPPMPPREAPPTVNRFFCSVLQILWWWHNCFQDVIKKIISLHYWCMHDCDAGHCCCSN
jgi:hypothetical protein